MIRKLKALFVAIYIASLTTVLHASQPEETGVIRPVESVYTIEAGSAHLADTYLTPLRYTGWSGAIGYTRRQAMKFNPEDWVMQLDGRVFFDRTLNLRRNATMYFGGVNFSWTMMRRWKSVDNLSFGVGPGASLLCGCLLNSRNGNNPASAKCSITVDGNLYAAYRLKAGRLNVTFRDQVAIPVTGVFFAPDYGELYYEIWLGNHSGLIHPYWWGNNFAISNLLSADLQLGNTLLRLGYRMNYSSSSINHIVSRCITHTFLIGIGGNWVSLNPSRQLSATAKMIYATY